MKKRSLFGVQKRKKKKPIKKISKKRGFVKKIFNYLKSDTYMFAPFILTSQRIFPFASGEEIKEDVKGEEKDQLVKKIVDYLKSDSYMYAPLCLPLTATCSSSKGHVKKVTVEIAGKKLIGKDNQSTVELSNVTVEDQFSEGDLPERNITGQQKLVHMETVNLHMVYHNCRSSPSGHVRDLIKHFLSYPARKGDF